MFDIFVMDVPGVALITGAASGIGRACALTFAKDGAAGLALFDINHEDLLAIKAQVEEQQARLGRSCPIEIATVDVSKEDQVQASVRAVVEVFGRIDYAVQCAGIAIKHAGGAAFAETEAWQQVLDVNLNGTFFVLKAVAKIMLKQDPILSSIDGRPLQRGSIVNFSSIQGLVGIPLSTSYAVSKHAVIGLTKTASEDYAAAGLRINAICPGYTETPLVTRSPPIFQAMKERVSTAVPMGRMGQPQEIADGVVYLAGGRSSFVTGISLSVDGGYTQR